MSPIIIEIFEQLGFDHIKLRRPRFQKSIHTIIHRQRPNVHARIVESEWNTSTVVLYHGAKVYKETALSLLTFTDLAMWISIGKAV